MKQGALAMTPAEVEGWAKVIGGVLAVATALGAGVVRAWRWWRRRIEMRRAEAKALRYLLDATHHVMHHLAPDVDDWQARPAILERHRVLIDSVWDELWLVDGHEAREKPAVSPEELRRWMTRTMKIRALEDRKGE